MTLDTIFQNVTEGKTAEVESGVQAALDSGISAEDILNKALIAAMDDVGQRFEAGDFFNRLFSYDMLFGIILGALLITGAVYMRRFAE